MEKYTKNSLGGITVSVIIPVYNKSPYLIDCLDSLKQQTYPHLEVLVIDDGSTDDSWEILRRYQKSWDGDTLRLFQISHSGPSVARDKGLEEATGEYVTFVDADDFLGPGYIEHLVRGIEDADLCISGHKVWFQRENRWKITRCPQGSLKLDNLGSMIYALGGIGWKMYSLPFLRSHNITFPVDIDQGEDTLFSSYVLLYASKIARVEYSEYVVRRHDLSSQIHRLVSVEMAEKVIEKYKELEERAKNENLKEYYRAQKVSHLAVIGRILCYKNLPMKERKKLFFSISRRYGVGGFHHDHSAQTITSIALNTHTFLPFYIITKLWYWKNDELRVRYEEEERQPKDVNNKED